MDIYKLLKINNYIKNHRIKFLGLWLLSVLNKRYLAIQFDPVLACNLRCKMCYFTDADFVKKNMKGIFQEEDLENLASVNFKNALKLQIGCGAEPTLFKHNAKLIQIAKKHKVPYISMITNGNLLDQKDIQQYAQSGLNEFILSMHGVLKTTYEDLMDKGDYEKFHEVLNNITQQKKINPSLKLRINYTFNADNFYELKDFFKVYNHYAIDVLQLRPIDKIGETTYNNFSLKTIEEDYITISNELKAEASKLGITLLFPKTIKREEEKTFAVTTENNSSYLLPYTYCYVSPKFYWRNDFDWREESFSDWKKKNNWNRVLFKNIFISRKELEKPNRNVLNYSVDLN